MTAILDALSRRQADWATLAKSDAGAFARGYVCVRKGMGVLADPQADDVRVDDATMTSWWTVSTPNIDREGDSLTSRGCLKTIANYKRNAVVLHEHNALWPVGVSVGDNGLPLIITDKEIRAGLKHHDYTDIARDVYKLVKGGILKGASIAFLPLKAKQLGEIKKGSLVSPRFRFDEWDCVHWSTTTQPQNPEGIRMSLSRGEVESDYFKKSLADFAQKPLEYAHGWEEPTVSKTVSFRDIQSIRFAKSAYPDSEAAKVFVAKIGCDPSVLVENDTSFDFVQQQGEHKESVKLAKGVQGLLLKTTPPPSPTVHVIAVDETPDEPVVAPVAKAMDEKPKPDAAKPKGPARVTHAVQSLGDVSNHVKGCKQYLQEAMGMLDHEPTVAFYKDLSEMQDTMAEKVKAHVGQHFDGVDMEKVSSDRAAAKEEEDAAKATDKKKQQKSLDDDAAANDAKLAKLSEVLAKRAPALDAIGKSLDAAQTFQQSVAKKLQIN